MKVKDYLKAIRFNGHNNNFRISINKCGRCHEQVFISMNKENNNVIIHELLIEYGECEILKIDNIIVKDDNNSIRTNILINHLKDGEKDWE